MNAEADELAATGLRLLRGEGCKQDPARASAAFEQALAMGSASAAARLAVLASSGVGRAQDWSEAFDFLEAAARLGDTSARRQLALLAGESDWRQARAGLSQKRWLERSPAGVLASSPRIAVLPRFIAPEVCRWLIERGEEELTPSLVYDPVTGEQRRDPVRSNSFSRLGLLRADVVVLLVQARIAVATGFPYTRMEAPNVLSYEPGQAFKLHGDFLNPDAPQTKAEIAALGQRIATFLIYLNADFDGGETEFPAAGLRYRGKPGDAILFHNVTPDGRPDPESLHAGLAPMRGRKWILSQWIRNKPQPIL